MTKTTSPRYMIRSSKSQLATIYISYISVNLRQLLLWFVGLTSFPIAVGNDGNDRLQVSKDVQGTMLKFLCSSLVLRGLRDHHWGHVKGMTSTALKYDAIKAN